MYRLSTDVGGTFTDGVLLAEQTGDVTISKVSTTPSNPAIGTYAAIDEFHVDLKDAYFLVHGTTVVINALIEEKGAKTALITTRGFRDVLEIGRSNRTNMYDALYEKPTPLVPRKLRFEVSERIDNAGEVLKTLDLSEIDDFVDKMRSEGVLAIAVCLLNSYVNPVHEISISEYISKKYPEFKISLSHEITRKYGEFERTSSTTQNAYVLPVVRTYLNNLETTLTSKNYTNVLQIMQSNGGVMTSDVAKQMPIAMVESGPAAGAIGAAAIAGMAGFSNVIAYDMGGTTAKAAVIKDGIPEVTELYVVEGRPIKVPVVDLREIGAGGGSIAWIDEAGALHVGPKSAGADPGPACYMRGGEDACVTDANLHLGRISAENFLGGGMQVSPERSRDAISRLSKKFGLSEDEMALGILKIVNTNMSGLLHSITLQRGYDPRDFVMVAFGGGGPLHAASIARELNIPIVLIPNHSGVFSAWGMIMADLRHEFTLTHIEKLNHADLAQINTSLRELRGRIMDIFRLENVKEENIHITYELDLRYYGQEHSLPVQIDHGLEEADKAALARRFDEKHLAIYGHNGPQEAKEIAGLKAIGIGRVNKPRLRPLPRGEKTPPTKAHKGIRSVYIGNGQRREFTIFQRDHLLQGNVIEGPAVVEEMTSTTIIEPGQVCRVDELGNLIISLEQGAQE
jgi:N-methylhydantoinase A